MNDIHKVSKIVVAPQMVRSQSWTVSPRSVMAADNSRLDKVFAGGIF
jgi:hypothetical protein